MSAYLIVGVKFTKDDDENIFNSYRKTEQIRGCKHDFSSNFCPECGAPRFQYKKVVMLPNGTKIDNDYVDVYLVEALIEYGLSGVMYAFTGRDVDSSYCYVVFLRDGINSCYDAKNGWLEMVNLPTPEQIEEYKNKLKDKLSVYGAWNEDNFGVWLIDA